MSDLSACIGRAGRRVVDRYYSRVIVVRNGKRRLYIAQRSARICKSRFLTFPVFYPDLVGYRAAVYSQSGIVRIGAAVSVYEHAVSCRRGIAGYFAAGHIHSRRACDPYAAGVARRGIAGDLAARHSESAAAVAVEDAASVNGSLIVLNNAAVYNEAGTALIVYAAAREGIVRGAAVLDRSSVIDGQIRIVYGDNAGHVVRVQSDILKRYVRAVVYVEQTVAVYNAVIGACPVRFSVAVACFYGKVSAVDIESLAVYNELLIGFDILEQSDGRAVRSLVYSVLKIGVTGVAYFSDRGLVVYDDFKRTVRILNS